MKSGQTLQERESKIKDSVLLSFERIGFTPFDTKNLVKDVNEEFSRVSIDNIQTAIRNGGLGKYGYTNKITTQIVCIWIREFLKEDSKKIL